MTVSVLVVSRTPHRLNRMLSSLEGAYSGPDDGLEVFCSWNGTAAEQGDVMRGQRFALHLISQIPYHFAANVNGLARRADGDTLVLLNDDLILDSGALDEVLLALADPSVGAVGGRLRRSDGRLSHMGIAFDPEHSAYHRLTQLPVDSGPALRAGPVPAVTGALLAIRRQDFLPDGLDESYRVCGEDVALCLRLRSQGRVIWYCPKASGMHDGEATRSEDAGQQACPEDLERLRGLHRAFLADAGPQEWRLEWFALAEESDHLRRILLTTPTTPGQVDASALVDLEFQLARARLELEDLRRHSQRQSRTIATLQQRLLELRPT
jgi:hypothetical protein